MSIPDSSSDKLPAPAGSRPRHSGEVLWEEATNPSAEPTDEPLKGYEVVAAQLNNLPSSPGVYRMMNNDGDVLYVGKARNLKNRVTSYSRLHGHSGRIARMITETAAMEFVTTHTETDALLLEANLIKRLKPRFNVLMRDDKSFPHILLSGDHEAPGLFKHRGARSRKGDYFGPFANAGAVNTTINALQRIFGIRTCTDSFYSGRSRPCLLHQIKRCAGPCTGEISKEDYALLVADTKAFLSGKSHSIKSQLSEKMEKASATLDFEHAAVYRDRLSALSHVQSHQGINPRTVDEADVFALHQEAGQNCVQVFFFRTGQNWGNRAYYPRADKSYEPAEVLGAFISQFYDQRPAPKLVLVSTDFIERELLEQALTNSAGKRVQIKVPHRGEKKELVDRALINARQALGRKIAENSSQAKLLSGVAEVFELESTPQRIEIYDNSHIMGTNAVGAMVVASADGFAKSQYRKFNIKSVDITPGDDYGMMREVMTRRFSRLLKENGRRADQKNDEDSIVPWPDLVLIDGGKGQLSAVQEVMKELGLEDEVPLVGIAKGPDRDAGRERFFMAKRESFMLPLRDPVLYFIQRMRDEAHRFAIGTHRAIRKKAFVQNPLDEIAGIGPSRKRAILHHFGSAKSTSRAAVEDLKAVEGISAQMAQAIYDHFHETK